MTEKPKKAIRKIIIGACAASTLFFSASNLLATSVHAEVGPRVTSLTNVDTPCPGQQTIATLQPGQTFYGSAFTTFPGTVITVTDLATGQTVVASTLPKTFSFNPVTSDIIQACVSFGLGPGDQPPVPGFPPPPFKAVGYVTYNITDEDDNNGNGNGNVGTINFNNNNNNADNNSYTNNSNPNNTNTNTSPITNTTTFDSPITNVPVNSNISATNPINKSNAPINNNTATNKAIVSKVNKKEITKKNITKNKYEKHNKKKNHHIPVKFNKFYKDD